MQNHEATTMAAFFAVSASPLASPFNYALVELVNCSLVELVNCSLVELVNCSLVELERAENRTLDDVPVSLVVLL